MRRIFRVSRRSKSTGAGDRTASGFTLVELLIAMIISLIIVGGMLALLNMTFNMFATSRNQQSITDSSRKALMSMSRQLKGALRLAVTKQNEMSFYADISNEYPGVTKANATLAPTVSFLLKYDAQNQRVDDHLWQRTTRPDGSSVEAVLASNVDDVNFYYYQYGTVPDLDRVVRKAIMPPEDAVSRKAAMVVIELKMKKGKVVRTYWQDVDFRVLDI